MLCRLKPTERLLIPICRKGGTQWGPAFAGAPNLQTARDECFLRHAEVFLDGTLGAACFQMTERWGTG